MGKYRIALLLLIILLHNMPAAAQILRITAGLCEPVILNRNETVNIQCAGVPPVAHNTLDEELARLQKQSRFSTNQLLGKAERWAWYYLLLIWNADTQQDIPGTAKSTELLHTKRLILDGRFEQAASLLDAQLSRKNQPAFIQAEKHFLRAGLYRLEFNERQATHHFTQAFTLQPGIIKYLLPYTETLIETRHYTPAEKQLQDILPVLRNTAQTAPLLQALEQLRIVYTRLARHDRAKPVAKEMLDLLQTFPATSENRETFQTGITAFRFGHAHYNDRLDTSASGLLMQAHRLLLPFCNQDDSIPCQTAAKAAALAGLIEAGRDKHTSALRHFEQAIDAHRSLHRQTPVDKIRITAIRHQIAEAQLKLEKIDKAIETWRQIADDFRNNEISDHEYLFMAMHAFNKLGEAAAAKPDYPQAELYFRRALELVTHNTRDELEIEISLAMMNLGHLALARGDAVEAKRHAEQATQVFHRYWLSDPETYQSYYLRSLFVLGLSNLSLHDNHVGCQQLLHVQKTDQGKNWDKLSREAYERKCQPTGETTPEPVKNTKEKPND